MKKLFRTVCCAAGLLAAVTSCQAAMPQAIEASESAYAMTETLFANRKTGENLIFSPYSVQQILSLVSANTTQAAAQEEMAPYVVPGIRREQLDNTKTGGIILLDKKLASVVTGQGRGDIHLVSYPGEALEAKKDFQKEILGSVIDEEVPAGHLTFLIAAHYYAEWAVKFDKKMTKNRPFITEEGHEFSVKTMKKHFEHGEGKITDTYEMAALPGKNHSTVYFIKPKTDTEKDRVAHELEPIIRSFANHEETVTNIDLEVPKISLKNKLDLNSLFKTMGLDCFYSGQLHFDRITGDVPYVLDSATQTATLDINEEYAEGKALTEMGFRTTAFLPDPILYNIKMDRPYFIVVVDQTKEKTKRVVFTAWIANPQDK